LREELLQSSDELVAEDSTQCVNGQKETPRGIDPSGTVESQAAGGNALRKYSTAASLPLPSGTCCATPAASPWPTKGADTRLILDYLGDRNTQHTVKYIATNPHDLKSSGRLCQ
jgi:hypothetical protein